MYICSNTVQALHTDSDGISDLLKIEIYKMLQELYERLQILIEKRSRSSSFLAAMLQNSSPVFRTVEEAGPKVMKECETFLSMEGEKKRRE